MNLHQSAVKGDLPAVRALLAGGSDPNQRSIRGETALIQAVEGGHFEVATALLDAGADVHATELFERWAGQGRWTPLVQACVRGDVPMVELLLARGAKARVTQADWDGEPRCVSPLFLALVALQPSAAAKIVPLLLAAGAEPNLFLSDTETILDRALIGGSKRVIALLRKAGAKTAAEIRAESPTAAPIIEDLCVAAGAGDLAGVKRLIAAGHPLEKPNDAGLTPLKCAASGGHEEVFHALLAAGAKCEENADGNWTLLTYAAGGGNLGIVKHLLAAGFAVDGTPNRTKPIPGVRPYKKGEPTNWHTPLMSACWGGRMDVVRLLLEAGANPEAKAGRITPQKWAKDGGHKEIVALLGGEAAKAFDRDPAKLAVKGFPTAAQSPGFQRILERVKAWTDREAKPWPKRKGVFVAMLGANSWGRLAEEFGLDCPTMDRTAEDQVRIENVRNRMQEEVLSLGGQILQNDLDQKRFLIYPTTDPYAPLVACGTNGINAGHDTEAVVHWLRNMAVKNPFRLVGCSFDWISGVFPGELVDPAELSKAMSAFCPDDTDPAEAAAYLAAGRRFSFWWD